MKLNDFFFFKNLKPNELEAITPLLKHESYPPQTTIIEQDSSTETAYFITSGSVSIFRLTESGQEVNLSVLGEGEMIGEMALIDRQPRSAFVKTITKTTILILTRQDFLKIVQTYPNAALQLLSLLTERIRNADLHLEAMITNDLKTRTWNTITVLNQYFDEEIILTHEELASIVGATRARVTEILNHFEKEGKITLSQRRIKVLV